MNLRRLWHERFGHPLDLRCDSQCFCQLRSAEQFLMLRLGLTYEELKRRRRTVVLRSGP